MRESLNETLGRRIAGSEAMHVINLIEFHQTPAQPNTALILPSRFLICVNLIGVKRWDLVGFDLQIFGLLIRVIFHTLVRTWGFFNCELLVHVLRSFFYWDSCFL